MGAKILVADDSVTIQKVVELTFAETDYDVVAVSSGTELLQRVAQEKPDLVLCDVVMPDISGYEVCQKLKSDPATLHIPVVLLTGTFEPFDRGRAEAAGCDAIVTKPFEARALIATVDELLAKAPPAAAPPSEEEILGLGVPEGVPALDFTTTGFDRMVPPPEKPPAPPEHGLELTASSLQSAVSPPPPAPPELAAPPQEPAFSSNVPGEAPSPWEQEQLPAAGEQPPLGTSFAPFQREEVPAPLPEQQAAAAAPLPPEPASTLSPEPATRPGAAPPAAPAVPEEEVETVPPGEFPTPQVAALGEADLDGLVERVVGEVLRRLPQPGPAAASAGLGEEELERLARRVLELATPLFERIAWEVIPDMAEMLVRQRIAELEAAAEEA